MVNEAPRRPLRIHARLSPLCGNHHVVLAGIPQIVRVEAPR